jgi:hypothetical protein
LPKKVGVPEPREPRETSSYLERCGSSIAAQSRRGVGVVEYVVYAVEPIPGEKPDPVPVVAGFPPGWCPTENPGQCLADFSTEARIFETFVPRSQFRHYERISQADALERYPGLSELLVE